MKAYQRFQLARRGSLLLLCFVTAACSRGGTGSHSEGAPPPSVSGKASPFAAPVLTSLANPRTAEKNQNPKNPSDQFTPAEDQAMMQDLMGSSRTSSDSNLGEARSRRSGQVIARAANDGAGYYVVVTDLRPTQLPTTQTSEAQPRSQGSLIPENFGQIQGVVETRPALPQTQQHTLIRLRYPHSGANEDGLVQADRQPTSPGAAKKSSSTEIWNTPLCHEINLASKSLELTPTEIIKIDKDKSPLVSRLPLSLQHMSNAELEKNRFICIVLPIAVRMNRPIFNQRMKVAALVAEEKRGEKLSMQDLSYLAQLKTDYGMSTLATDDELLKRVDVIPVAMILAQAAIETNWGTSASAHDLNNLFGIRGKGVGASCKTAPGLKSGECLRKYPSLVDGMSAYIRIMNTAEGDASTFAENFRALRAELRAHGERLDSEKLIGTLNGYSESGPSYVREVKALLGDDGTLQKYDGVK